MTLVKIFIPEFCQDVNNYFTGCVKFNEPSCTNIYITKCSTNSNIFENITNDKDGFIMGCFGYSCLSEYISFTAANCFELSNETNMYVKHLCINNINIDTSNCVIIFYNHEVLRLSQTISDTEPHFSTLQNILNKDDNINTTNTDTMTVHPECLKYSMFLQHIFICWNLVTWLTTSIKRDKKISIKQGNLFMAIITDILLGCVILQFLSEDKTVINSKIMSILENLIIYLDSLLKWLMGAPVGLKLNNAFNKMLGKYFSYHVQLWWLFLDVSGDKLDTILHVYHYIGYLGLTFQTALISDMICIATFHSYCIYVYAARLFNIQISGLIALLRLFVGRKYNPLRGSIDSCEYTNQELYVGTVAFTVLLLLLPTTAMYYIVFTLFRILSLTVQFVLAKLICIIQTLPVYVAPLWLAHSPRVAGNVFIEVISQNESSPLILRANLFRKSIGELINSFQPPVQVPKQAVWANFISNILVGKQLN